MIATLCSFMQVIALSLALQVAFASSAEMVSNTRAVASSRPSRPRQVSDTPGPTPPPVRIRGHDPLLAARKHTSTSSKLCTMINVDLSAGNKDAKCLCDSSILLTPMIVDMPTIYTQSCDYTAMPTIDATAGNRSVPTITSGIFNGPMLGSTYAKKPPATSVTMHMGSSSIHVGPLTGTALSSSIASVLDEACPTAAPPTPTACGADKVPIDHIAYKDINGDLGYGVLEIQVQFSNYTDNAPQRASLAGTANGSNCEPTTFSLVGRYKPGVKKRRWLPPAIESYTHRLLPRSDLYGSAGTIAHQETHTFCATVMFAEVDLGTDVRLSVHLDFVHPPVTPVACQALEMVFNLLPFDFPGVSLAVGAAEDVIDLTCSLGDDDKDGDHKRKKGGKNVRI